MNSIECMESAERDLLHTYNRFGIVLEYGKGVYLYDADGKKYLDFASGIGVCGLGYGNEEYTKAIQDQAGKLLHTSNLYYNQPTAEAAFRLKAASGMDRVFFTNSGAEAVEGAVKAAKKYAYTRDGRAGHEVIAMEHSFHGRTLGALSVTGNQKYQEPFGPLIPGIRFAKFNCLASVEELIGPDTCAILLETVQGEGGIFPAEQSFLEGVAAICRERDILLILDEIQCGMGRSGKMFAWQNYGVKPDLMAAAKALGGGVPVGAFLMTERVAEKSLAPGDHGTTYGGNPLVGAAVAKTLEIMERDRLTEHVQEMSGELWSCLERLKEKFSCIRAHRGLGLMQGIELAVPVGEVARRALRQGLIVITAGSDVLRFLPPLVIEKGHIDEMRGILEGVLAEF